MVAMSCMLIHTTPYSKPSDLLPKTEGSDLDKPGKDEVKKSTVKNSTEDTRNALEKLISAKVRRVFRVILLNISKL